MFAKQRSSSNSRERFHFEVREQQVQYSQAVLLVASSVRSELSFSSSFSTAARMNVSCIWSIVEYLD